MRRSTSSWALAGLLSLGALSVGACKKEEAQAPAAVHATTGVIKEIKQEGRVLVIAHEEFPGFMEAMTMGFELKDPKKAEGLKAGDKVQFSIQEAKDAWPIVEIKKVGK